MDKERIVEIVKEWIQVDNDMKELQKILREKRSEKKELSDILVDVMRNNEIDEFDVSEKEGKLVYKKKVSKSGLTKKYMMEQLEEYFKEEPEEGNKLMEYLIENRKENVKESISRKGL
jgi:hypothetical protein